MDKTLILKNEDNDFEKYISDNMRTDCIEVYSPYKKTGQVLHYIRAICKRLNIHMLIGIWLNNWKYKLDEYKTIIIFDNGVSEELLKWIKKEDPLCNLKVWLWNVPSEKERIFKKYANVYCFDEKYSLEHNLYFIDQFYFKPVKSNKTTVKYDLSFIGLDKNRYKIIEDIAFYLNRYNRKFYFYIVDEKITKERNYRQAKSMFIVRNEKITYKKVLQIVQESKAVLEILKKDQEGLTLRALEAMFYQKKLVTNNKSISKYEWYNPDNVFILGVDNMDKLGGFLDSPFVNIDKEFLYRHTYKSWLTAITRDMHADVIGERKNAGN